jgi:hypothetical protein
MSTTETTVEEMPGLFRRELTYRQWERVKHKELWEVVGEWMQFSTKRWRVALWALGLPIDTESMDGEGVIIQPAKGRKG